MRILERFHTNIVTITLKKIASIIRFRIFINLIVSGRKKRNIIPNDCDEDFITFNITQCKNVYYANSSISVFQRHYEMRNSFIFIIKCVCNR